MDVGQSGDSKTAMLYYYTVKAGTFNSSLQIFYLFIYFHFLWTSSLENSSIVRLLEGRDKENRIPEEKEGETLFIILPVSLS